MTNPNPTASLEANLRLGNGLTEHDRQRVLHRLSALDARLRSFRADAVDLLVTVKERDTRSQRTTLQASIADQPPLVASSTHTGLDEALSEVGREVGRLLTGVKTRREPAHQHHHDAGATR
jgi:ribosome-associated translation inhibitor RaiA